MKIKFCGAAREVTGSCHLIELSDGYRILLDSGLYQGKDEDMQSFNRHLLFKPDSIDTVILSHAHIDHTGRLPYLVRKGLKASVHCTHATRSLCTIMLKDSAMIQERDAQYQNRKLRKQGKSSKHFVEPLYTDIDVSRTLSMMVGHSYDTWFKVSDRVSVYYSDAGHILGSSSVVLKIRDGGKERLLGFTGDIGRPNRPILRDPQSMHECDYMICESTYGDRIHESKPEEIERFLRIIHETCVVNRGKLIIPAFSVGRTQEIVYILDQLENEGRLPRIPVYVDSPLSVNATKIFGIHPECYDRQLQKYLLTDPNPFGFNHLNYVTEIEESKRINHSTRPSIIISSAGMANAGRVQHHLINNIEDPKNTVLLVGYCAPYTPGGMLKNGVKELKLHGQWLQVNASIQTMDSFSAHGDQEEMMAFLENQRKSNQRLFLVHGEYDAQKTFAKKLGSFGFGHVSIPDLGSQVMLT